MNDFITKLKIVRYLLSHEMAARRVLFSKKIFPAVIFLLLALRFLTANSSAHEAVSKICIYDNQLRPQKIEIFKDEKILFENASSHDRKPVASFRLSAKTGPKTFSPEKPIKPGKTWLFKFIYVGTWNIYDKSNPNLTAQVTTKVGRGITQRQKGFSCGQENIFSRIFSFFSEIIKSVLGIFK